MAIQCCRRDASTVLCAQQKRKRNVCWSAKPPVETNLRSLILIMTPVAQMLRNVHELSSLKLTAHVRVPRIPTLFRPSRAERFSFQLLVHPLLEFSHDPTRQF